MTTSDKMMRDGSEIGLLPDSNRGIFYGWWIVASSIVILFASSGIGFYAHGVILDPIRAQYGWSKGVVSSAITLYFAASAFAGIFVGQKIDKYGPKPFLIGGALVFSLSYFLLSRIDQVWQLFFVYFLVAVGWSGSSLLSVNTLITNWFIQKRGLAMSITMTGLSLGGMVLVPLASYLIVAEGFQTAIISLSVIYALVIIPCTLFFIKARPSDLNLQPDGVAKEAYVRTDKNSNLKYESQLRTWTRKEAFATSTFWSIVIAFSLALCVQMAFLVHQVSFLSIYLGKMGAAAAVSITAGASIMGRLTLGTFVDRFDKRYTAMICFLAQGLAVLTLAFSQQVAVLYFCTFLFGLTMGSMLMMLPLITGECFGMVSFGMISGMIGVFSTSGASLGPMIAGFIFDATQSYQMAFILFASFSLVAMLVVSFARPPEKIDNRL
ncbi:MAG: MFS transporter [Deltaproteobacteria bacterium]|nr:MFS transporter [Deltaproteobacteria bacterium]